MYKKRIGLIGASTMLALLALLVSLIGMKRPVQAEPQEGGGVADALTVDESDESGVDVTIGGPWMPLGSPMMPGGQVNAIAVDPDDSDGDTVYATVAPVGTYDSGPSTVYKTEDGGQSWSEVFSRDSAQIHALASGGEYVFAGVFNPGGNTRPVLYVNSGFGGGSWTGVVEFDYRGVIADVVAHPVHFDAAVAGGWAYDDQDIQHGVVYSGFGSLDSNWSQILDVTFPDGEAMVNAVMVHPVTPTLVYASVQNTATPDTILYRSDDGGATWPYTTTIPNAAIISLAANTATPNLIYAGSGIGPFFGGPSQVWRSEDAGLTWSLVNGNGGTHLAYEPPSTVYAIADWGEVWASTADGAAGTWNSVGGVWSPADLDIDLNVATPTLYAGIWDGGIHKSANGGVDWEAVNGDIETPVAPVDIDVDPTNPNKLFVAAECGLGWMTEDGGASWTEATGACAGAFAINPDDPDIVYLGEFNDSRGAVLRSNDGGMNFTPVYTAPFIMPDGSGGDEAIFDLAIAPSLTTTVYAAGADHPNWEDSQAVAVRSLDDGASWTVVFTLPETSSISVVSIDPTDDDVVYLGGEDCNTGGPFCWHFIERTTDGGDTWTRVLSNTHGSVESIVVDYQKPNVLYAATNNYEVYKSSDGGDSWTIVRQYPPDLSGYLLALDPNVPSHVYLGGHGYIAESVDGGLTWSEWDAPINQGTPGMEPTALVVDNGSVTQTFYAGFSGVWAYSRWAPVDGPRYVATSGTDAGNGCADPAAPCATIGHAIDVASSGETILIAAGTYVEHDLEINGETLTLRGGYTIDGDQWLTDTGETIVDANGAGRVFHIHGNDSVLDSLTITGGDTPDMQCWGGGVWATNGHITIRNSVLVDNTADCSGGGVEVNNDFGPAHLTLVDTIVVDNHAGDGGGGVTVWHTGATLTNTLITSNTASNFAGALRIEDSDVVVQNSTVADNTGGAAIDAFDTNAQPDSLTIRNSIVWDNMSTNLSCAVQTCTVTYSDVGGGWTGAGNIDADPLFVGGGDYHLAPDSPCVDAGTSTGAPDHDLDGAPRPEGDGVDMGAYEWQPWHLYLPIVMKP